jgi:hypothetical protein
MTQRYFVVQPSPVPMHSHFGAAASWQRHDELPVSVVQAMHG